MWFMLVWLFVKFWGIVVVEMRYGMLIDVFVICDDSWKNFK